MANPLYLGLGTNIENRQLHMEAALCLLQAWIGPCTVSSIYESAAWGMTRQPNFLNCVALIWTDMPPDTILEKTQRIELCVGRKHRKKWHEREIDIDLLFYGETTINTPRLTIPHPYVEKRNFVLVPMSEISPYFRHPISGKTMEQMTHEIAMEESMNLRKFFNE